MKWLLFLLIYSSQLLGVEITRKDFCLEYSAGTGPKAVRTELLTRSIKIEDDINPHLLGVLAGIFREYQFYGPLRIKLADTAGPKKAWVTGRGEEKVLWLAKNASELILGLEIQKVVDKVCNDKSDKVHELSITWTNTVYEQILRDLIEPKSISKRFVQVSGWQLESPTTDPDHLLEQPFRDEEVVTIVKQFIDLPYDVLRLFGIKYMARAKVGRDVDGAAGIYNPEKQKILLTDGAFFSGADIYGEGTVLHEFGHAWWFNQTSKLQDNFSSISWMKEGGDWVKKELGIKGFVSQYAASKPSEDFAESFSAFVHEPEKIIDLAKMKFLFLRQYTFQDITYFSTVAENAKVFVDSKTTDKKPPYLEDSLRKCLKITQEPTTAGNVVVKARLDCVWDIMSGPAETSFSLAHEKYPEIYIYIKLKPLEGRKLGEPWVLEGEGREKVEKIITGNYIVKTLPLVDKAGNQDYLDGMSVPPVPLVGAMGTLQPQKEEMNWAAVKQTPIQEINGHPGYEIELPIKHQENLTYLFINNFHSLTQEKSTHIINEKGILSKPGDSKIRYQVFFSKYNLAGRIDMTSLSLEYAGSSETIKYKDEYVVPKGVSAVHHDAKGSVDYRGDLNVNGMVLSAFEGANIEGGKWSIKMRIPVERNSQTKFSIWVTVRAPSGGSLGFYIVEDDLEKKGHKLISENDQLILEANLPLKIHPERGNYLFESFEMKTKFPHETNNPRALENLEFNRRIKLIERGIKKEFKIRPDNKLDFM